MSRTFLPFHADDISALARSLKTQIDSLDHAPGHVEVLNMLARSGGWRNFQHFRTQASARDDLANTPPKPALELVDFVKVRRTARHFDTDGRLVRWPSKRSEQQICLWVIWSGVPSKRILSEREVNAILEAAHTFGDYALLRRWMCDYGMLDRTRDGSEYRRIEHHPPAESLALIDHLKPRRKGIPFSERHTA